MLTNKQFYVFLLLCLLPASAFSMNIPLPQDLGQVRLNTFTKKAGMAPVMINYGRGSSWRNIAGGRENFSLPELSEIASCNHEIFRELQLLNSDYLRQRALYAIQDLVNKYLTDDTVREVSRQRQVSN